MSGEGEKYEGNNRLALLKYVDTISKKKIKWHLWSIYTDCNNDIPFKILFKDKTFCNQIHHHLLNRLQAKNTLTFVEIHSNF